MLLTADAIERESDLFDMSTYLFHASCGTMRCIAGQAYLLANGLEAKPIWIGATFRYEATIVLTAQRWLDLTHDEANRLFYGDWPEPYWSDHHRPGATNKERAQVAAQLLRDVAAGRVSLTPARLPSGAYPADEPEEVEVR